MPSKTADFSQASFGLNVNLAIGAPVLLADAPGTVVVEPSMLAGANGFSVLPLLTVGETLLATSGALNASSAGRYTPIGNLDGIGAYQLDASTVRLFVNHEVGAAAPYAISDGGSGSVSLNGARISYLDVDVATLAIVDGGIAYDTIHDRQGQVVAGGAQMEIPGGLANFCSSALFEANLFGSGRGTAERIYFAGEEVSASSGHPHGGTEWALDVAAGELWAVPDMGRGKWENVAQLDTGDTSHVAFLLDDDSSGAALYLYVGEKHAGGDFLDRNGLRGGQLYAWHSNTGELSPSQFPSGSRAGTWVPIPVRDASHAGQPGYDALGYLDDTTLTAAADAVGAFSFRRPEDVSTNPANGKQAVVATTGIEGSSNRAGTLYTVTSDFADLAHPTAVVTVLYNSNTDATKALRNPDNLDWADDGRIYVQEDRATSGLFGAGAANPHEASIVRIDPSTGAIERVAEMQRAAVSPVGSSDSAPGDVGNWESSGILDVSSLFGRAPGTLFVADVQAHSIVDGAIASQNLAAGGQLVLIAAPGVSLPQAVSRSTLGDVADVIGSAFDDMIIGGAAANTLNGGPGNDTLAGGPGDDRFVYAPGGGADVFADFAAGAGSDDKIDLTAFPNVHTLADVRTHAHQNGSDTVLDFGSGDTITLQHVAQANLNVDDFLGLTAVHNDVNGDAPSDVLWRRDDGIVGIWEMNGFQLLSGQGVAVQQPNDWHAEGTGDFNGDGRGDILWRHDNGMVSIWEMNGFQLLSGQGVNVAQPLEWHMAGTGDFNGDGKSDILWRHDNGTVSIWEMNGFQLLSGQGVDVAQPLEWHIAGAGDFNGDGKSDILWRHDNGTVSIWEMNGFQLLSGQGVNVAQPLQWQVAGTGDFNGDGKSDILWRHDNGMVSIWEMNGFQLLSGQGVAAQPNDWRVEDVGDFNADDKSDILWRHDSGFVGIWEMNGFQLLSGQGVAAQPADWDVIA